MERDHHQAQPAIPELAVAVNAERQPVVFSKDGEVFASSRDVAETFGKNHADVMRSIRTLIEQAPDLRLRNFAETVFSRENPSGGAPIFSPGYDMTRDGFTLLAMGFTGAKALKWKLRYIEAFNAMEAELRARPRVMIDFTDPKVLLGCLEHLQGQVRDRDAKIAVQGERLMRLDRIETAESSLCFTDAAKVLKMRRKALDALLMSREWVYRRVSGPLIGYQSKVQAGLLEHTVYPYTRKDGSHGEAVQCRITTKGLAAIADMIAKTN